MTQRPWVCFLVTATLLLGSASSIATAQNARGILVGTVKDVRGAVLQGAKVELDPRAASTVTDTIGEFTITDLAPGTYTVTVSYVGFSSLTSKVDIKAGQAAHLDAVLKVASEHEEITVTAERAHGEAEAINRERASDNILQVLPVEVITSLPNTISRTRSAACPASPSSGTREKESTFKSAARSLHGATSPSTGWRCRLLKAEFGRSNSTPCRPTSSNRWKSIRLFPRIRMVMRSAGPSILSPRKPKTRRHCISTESAATRPSSADGLSTRWTAPWASGSAPAKNWAS